MITTNNGAFPWRALEGADDLTAALAARAGGAGDPQRLRQARDRVIRRAIDSQTAAGCDLPTDGLVRFDDSPADLLAGLEGIEIGPRRSDGPAGARTYRVPIVRHEIAWKGPVLVEDYLFAARGLDRRLKMVLPGPYTLAALAEDHAYGDRMTLAMAFATALNQELRALQAAQAPWVQIDEPAILSHAGEFPLFSRIWEVLGRGIGMTLALHLEGGDIAPVAAALGRLKRLGCLSVDCVTVPGNLETVCRVPLAETTLVSLGLVDGADPEAGTPETIAARLRSARDLPPAGRLVLGNGTSLADARPAAAIAALRALDGARRLLAPA